MLPLQSKREVAEAILDAVEEIPWPMSGSRYLQQQIELGGAEVVLSGTAGSGGQRGSPIESAPQRSEESATR